MLGLYVHVPFCAAICNYCNFNRGLFDADLKAQYVAALLREIEQAAARPSDAGGAGIADTLFFGGGTPSLLEPSEVASIVDACRGAFALTADAEVTLEANPETVTPERLAGFRAAGINRLSFGVQSFRDEELQRLSRLHSASRASAVVAMAREAGFDNLSLDLMMWLPGQSVAQWLESVDALIGVAPDHASLYLLEIYPNAPLRDAMARGQWSVAPDDDAADMYLEAMARLDAAGYEQYEISNTARRLPERPVCRNASTAYLRGGVPGRGLQSRHNLKYWIDGEWIGFGPGAHTTRHRPMMTAERTRNVSATLEYIAAVNGRGQLIAERRHVSREERFEEALFTGLRLAAGLDLKLVESRYGVDVWRGYGAELAPFVDEGLLIYDDAGLRLTRRGMLLAHEVMTVFIRSTTVR